MYMYIHTYIAVKAGCAVETHLNVTGVEFVVTTTCLMVTVRPAMDKVTIGFRRAVLFVPFCLCQYCLLHHTFKQGDIHVSSGNLHSAVSKGLHTKVTFLHITQIYRAIRSVLKSHHHLNKADGYSHPLGPRPMVFF